jgi:WD40 repeat protein
VLGGTGLAHRAESAKQVPASEAPIAPERTAGKPTQEEQKVRTDRYGDPLPEGALARLGTIRFRHGLATYKVAFSPDGRMIACAAGGGGGGVWLWDAATGKVMRQIGEQGSAISVAFSPDSKVLACYFSWPMRRAALYETATGRKTADLPQNTTGLLGFSPDGKTLAAETAPDFAIHLFDAATGKSQNKQTAPKEDRTDHMAWSPDGRKIVWVGQKGFIHLWDVDKGEEIGQWKGHSQAIYHVAFAPDGKTLATVSRDQTIRLWEVATHKEKYVLDGKPQQIQNEWWPALVFSHDGRVLASNHSDGTIALWDAAEGKEIRRWQAHVSAVSSLDFAPDDKTLVSAALLESGPRLWDVAAGTEVRPFAAHTAPIEHVMFSEDGKRVVSLGWDKKIFDWDLTNGRGTLRIQLPFHAGPQIEDRNILSPRGDRAASWSDKEDTIRIWDMATGKERTKLRQSGNGRRGYSLGALAFSPDNQLLAFGTEDNTVVLWDVVTGVERRRLKGLTGQASCAVFSRDGQKIAVGSDRAGSVTMGLWDVTSGKLLSPFSSGQVHRLALSYDGTLLVSSSLGNGPRLWDGLAGRELRPLLEAPRFALGLAFSPDGKWLAATEEAINSTARL